MLFEVFTPSLFPFSPKSRQFIPHSSPLPALTENPDTDAFYFWDNRVCFGILFFCLKNNGVSENLSENF